MGIKAQEYEQEIKELLIRFSGVYASESGRKTAQSHIQGLFGTSERKNGWQLDEYVGAATPYKLQQFSYRGRFSAYEMRDIQIDYIAKN